MPTQINGVKNIKLMLFKEFPISRNLFDLNDSPIQNEARASWRRPQPSRPRPLILASRKYIIAYNITKYIRLIPSFRV